MWQTIEIILLSYCYMTLGYFKVFRNWLKRILLLIYFQTSIIQKGLGCDTNQDFDSGGLLNMNTSPGPN